MNPIPTDDSMICEDIRAHMTQMIREAGGTKRLMLAVAETLRPNLLTVRAALGSDDRELVGRGIYDAFMARVLSGAASYADEEADLDDQDSSMSLVRWALDGTPIFTLTESLTASLILTDPGSVPADCICWPFETFVVEIPRGFLSTQYKNTEEDVTLIQPHRYLVARSPTEGPDPVGYMPEENQRLIAKAARAVRRGEWKLALELVREHRALIEARWPLRFMASVRLYSAMGTSLFRRDRYPEGDESIGRWYGSKRDQTTGTMLLTEEDHYATQVAARIVTNLCIYIQTKVGALVPRSMKPRRVKPGKDLPARKLRPEKHFELGHEIRLPRLMLDAARACARQGVNKAAWKLMARQVVRGHTKLQRCGMKGAERKLITVAPYERYKRVLEQARKVYRVETPEERVQP